MHVHPWHCLFHRADDVQVCVAREARVNATFAAHFRGARRGGFGRGDLRSR